MPGELLDLGRADDGVVSRGGGRLYAVSVRVRRLARGRTAASWHPLACNHRPPNKAAGSNVLRCGCFSGACLTRRANAGHLQAGVERLAADSAADEAAAAKDQHGRRPAAGVAGAGSAGSRCARAGAVLAGRLAHVGAGSAGSKGAGCERVVPQQGGRRREQPGARAAGRAGQAIERDQSAQHCKPLARFRA